MTTLNTREKKGVADCVANKQVLQSFCTAACEFCREVLRRVLQSASALNVTWTYGRACSVVASESGANPICWFLPCSRTIVIVLAQFDGERSTSSILRCSVRL